MRCDRLYEPMERKKLTSESKHGVLKQLQFVRELNKDWECFDAFPKFESRWSPVDCISGYYYIEIVRFDSAHERAKYLRERNGDQSHTLS